jgi:kynureninase
MAHAFVPREGADGWQVSNPPILALAPLATSLEIFDEVGMEALRLKSERLTGYLERLICRIPAASLELLTPRHPQARGCQLSLRIPHGARGVARSLEAAGVVADFREPDVIRVAPVPLYNSFHEIWRFAQILSTCLGDRA